MDIRKVSFAFIILSLLLITACGNKQYDEAIENGKIAVEDENYEEAIDFFEEALDEKEDDEIANTYIKQTKFFVEGLALNEDDLEGAKNAFTHVTETEGGLSVLEERAKEQIKEIEELEATYSEIEDMLASAKKEKEAGSYDKAIEIIDQVLEEDLAHTYFSEQEKEANKLKSDADNFKKIQEQASEAKKKAKTLADKKEYKEAIQVLDKVLEVKMDHSGLTSSKKELQKEKDELNKKLEKQIAEEEKKKAEEEKKQKREKLQHNLTGYWVEKVDDSKMPGRTVMKFSSDEYVWAIMESDTMEYAQIEHFDVNVEENKVVAQTTSGSDVVITVINDNEINSGNTNYIKVNEKEMEDIIADGRTAGEFFEFLKEAAQMEF